MTMEFTVHITLTALQELERRFARIRRQAPMAPHAGWSACSRPSIPSSKIRSAVHWRPKTTGTTANSGSLSSANDNRPTASSSKSAAAWSSSFMVFILRVRYGSQDFLPPGEL
jgi:hypothetical protein